MAAELRISRYRKLWFWMIIRHFCGHYAGAGMPEAVFQIWKTASDLLLNRRGGGIRTHDLFVPNSIPRTSGLWSTTHLAARSVRARPCASAGGRPGCHSVSHSGERP
jgi:hypothetical protein